MKIALCGDTFLRCAGEAEGDRDLTVIPEYWNADFRVANLEHAIGLSIWAQNKAVLALDRHCLREAESLMVDAVCLANNHIHDLGDEGIASTLDALKERGIGAFGAGLTLDGALKPFMVSKEFGLIGFCDYGQSYLREVQIATESRPGVAGLSTQNVERSLDKLPAGAKAIVYLHWGMENTSIQPPKNLNIAKQLLSDARIALVVGMHPHLIQGRVTAQEKHCYMSIGHFYWPDFILCPPNISADGVPPFDLPRTMGYHNVVEVTRKVWRRVNRTGLIVFFDTSNDAVKHIAVSRSERQTYPRMPNTFDAMCVRARFNLVSFLYRIPLPIYGLIWAFTYRKRYVQDVSKVVILSYRAQGWGGVWRLFVRKAKGFFS